MKDDKLSWVFLLCACTILILVCGVLSIFSIFYVTLTTAFGADKIIVAWIGSVAYGLSGITSPLTSLIISHFGSRLAVTTGCILCAASLILSSFVTRVELLFVTFSVMFGFGNSLVYTTSICQLGDKFNRYLAVATGVMVSSTGLGMLILSPLSFALINQLGWRQTLIVLSGITALTTLGTITYASKKQMTSSSPGGASPAQVEHFRNVDIVTTIKHIWSSRRFLVFLLSAACVEFGNSVPYMFLVPFAINDVGVTAEVSSYVLMASGGAKAVGRILFGKLVGCPCLSIKHLSLYQMALIIAGAGYLTLSKVNSLPLLLTYMITLSFVESIPAVLMPHLLTQAVGEHSRVFGWGFMSCSNAVFFMIGPPIAGMISDSQQSLTSAFYISGSSILLGALVLFGMAERQLPGSHNDRPTVSTTQSQAGVCLELIPVPRGENTGSESLRFDRQDITAFPRQHGGLDPRRLTTPVGIPLWRKKYEDNGLHFGQSPWSRPSYWSDSDFISKEVQIRSKPRFTGKAVGPVTSTSSSATLHDLLSNYDYKVTRVEPFDFCALRSRKSRSCSEIDF